MEPEQETANTDEELLVQIKNGDDRAMERLIVRYKNMVRKNAKALYLIGGEKDDLIQEGMIGLYKAIRDYDKDKGVKFATFASLCVSRQIYTAIQASNRCKNLPLNDYVSFDAAKENEYGMDAEALYPDAYFMNAEANPENVVISRENDEQIMESLRGKLSGFEMQVLKAYLEEESYARVAKRLGKSMKTVDNALQRIRRKLSEKKGR